MPMPKRRVAHVCTQCGASFELTPSEHRYGWGKFCSIGDTANMSCRRGPH